MTRRTYFVAAALALAFSSTAFANDPATRAGAGSSTSASPQCDSLTGAKKEQCLQQAQRTRDSERSAAGATSGGGSTGAAGNAAKSPAAAATGASPSPR